MSLEQASAEVQLAVDLIYLLEINQLSPHVVLAALDLVKRDYEKKLQHCRHPPPYFHSQQSE